jgi:hypothetical protein
MNEFEGGPDTKPAFEVTNLRDITSAMDTGAATDVASEKNANESVGTHCAKQGVKVVSTVGLSSSLLETSTVGSSKGERCIHGFMDACSQSNVKEYSSVPDVKPAVANILSSDVTSSVESSSARNISHTISAASEFGMIVDGQEFAEKGNLDEDSRKMSRVISEISMKLAPEVNSEKAGKFAAEVDSGTARKFAQMNSACTLYVYDDFRIDDVVTRDVEMKPGDVDHNQNIPVDDHTSHTHLNQNRLQYVVRSRNMSANDIVDGNRIQDVGLSQNMFAKDTVDQNGILHVGHSKDMAMNDFVNGNRPEDVGLSQNMFATDNVNQNGILDVDYAQDMTENVCAGQECFRQGAGDAESWNQERKPFLTDEVRAHLCSDLNNLNCGDLPRQAEVELNQNPNSSLLPPRQNQVNVHADASQEQVGVDEHSSVVSACSSQKQVGVNSNSSQKQVYMEANSYEKQVDITNSSQSEVANKSGQMKANSSQSEVADKSGQMKFTVNSTLAVVTSVSSGRKDVAVKPSYEEATVLAPSSQNVVPSSLRESTSSASLQSSQKDSTVGAVLFSQKVDASYYLLDSTICSASLKSVTGSTSPEDFTDNSSHKPVTAGVSSSQNSVVSSSSQPEGENGKASPDPTLVSTQSTPARRSSTLSCSLCDVTCKTASSLKTHYLSHIGNNLRHLGYLPESHVTCDVCGKKFVSLSYLEKHMMRHSGEASALVTTSSEDLASSSSSAHGELGGNIAAENGSDSAGVKPVSSAGQIDSETERMSGSVATKTKPATASSVQGSTEWSVNTENVFLPSLSRTHQDAQKHKDAQKNKDGQQNSCNVLQVFSQEEAKQFEHAESNLSSLPSTSRYSNRTGKRLLSEVSTYCMSATEKSSNSAKRQRRSTSSQLLSLSSGMTATNSTTSNEKSEGWLSSCIQNFEPLQPFDNLQFETRQEQDAENGEKSHSRPESVQSDALRQSGRARKSETRIQNSVVKCELTPPTGVQQSQALDKIEPCIVRR